MAGLCHDARENAPLPTSERIVRIVILVYFVGFASAFAFLTPIGAGFDEWNHLAFANYVARTGRIPNQYVAHEAIHFEGHQPPLYYFLAAGLLRPINDGDAAGDFRPDVSVRALDRRAAYVLRSLSVALATLNLLLVFRVAGYFPLAGKWRCFPAAFVATLPQFAYVSGSVNNDNLANLTVTAAIVCLLEILTRPVRLRPYLLFGCCLGLGLLTKKTALFLVPVAAAEFAYLLWRGSGERARLLLRFAAAGLLCAFISGWLFVRNHRLYGEWLGTEMEERTLQYLVDKKPFWAPYFVGRLPGMLSVSGLLLTGFQALAPLLPLVLVLGAMGLAGAAGIARAMCSRRRPGAGTILLFLAPGVGASGLFYWVLASWYAPGEFGGRLYSSAIGSFGSWEAQMPTAVYLLYAGLLLAALGGLALHVWQHKFRVGGRIGLALALIGSCFTGVVYYNTTYSQAQGRFLFPVLSLIGVLVALGLQALLARFRRSHQLLALGLVAGALLASDAIAIAILANVAK
jgi:4-amino-4-deoxy-L-arabinose transferase-like glycosyltransferase